MKFAELTGTSDYKQTHLFIYWFIYLFIYLFIYNQDVCVFGKIIRHLTYGYYLDRKYTLVHMEWVAVFINCVDLLLHHIFSCVCSDSWLF